MNLSQGHTLKYPRIRVGITMGDPSGIGPQIIAKALNKLNMAVRFVIIGDKWVFDNLKRYGVSLSKGTPFGSKDVKFIDLNNVCRRGFSFGRIKPEYGRASIEYLDEALNLIKQKEIDCLVTAPISKEAINLAGFTWTGHTEYLIEKTMAKDIEMMLLNKNIKTVLLTRHIPLKRVSAELRKDRIIRAIMLTYKSLRELFLLPKPRIVVCGLNPHASDNGVIGDEENKIIKPALMALKDKIKHLDGPLPADIAMLKIKNREYDCAISMYHDQALIPLKLSGGYTGVNMTLGLSFIRTSPLHGTAFDIAKGNKADPASLIAAIKLAVKCTLNLKKV